MMKFSSFLALALVFGATTESYACGSGGGSEFAGPAGDGGASDGEFFSDSPYTSEPTPHDDFKNPVLTTGAPPNAPQLFGAPDQPGTGPCLYEPELGSLFPNNWLRPRFRWNAANQENLFEIKLVVPN